MAVYVSPTGNPEVWDSRPENYMTIEEWNKKNPPETNEFDETINYMTKRVLNSYEKALLSIISPNNQTEFNINIETSLFTINDPEGFEFIVDKLSHQRDELLNKLKNAKTVDEIYEIEITYNV